MRALFYFFAWAAASYFILFSIYLFDGDYFRAFLFAGGCAVSVFLGFNYKSSASADENK